MNTVTVRYMDPRQADDLAPPPGTAIMRPLRYVRAVRERYAQRFTDPSEVAASRSARAWGWALGECATAPVTDRETAVPPSRSDIEVEIAAADERRLRGDPKNRADAAATILRWLIGNDDHVPVRGENRGELVGGFGNVVRSRQLIADVLALAAEGRLRAAATARSVDAGPDVRRLAQREGDYLGGVVATLSWVIGERSDSPLTRRQSREPTARDLKTERVRAKDVVEQARNPGVVGCLPSPWFGEGVNFTITWLLGDSTAQPVDPAGHGPIRPGQRAAYNAL
jgi:hypothetical protein